MGVLIGELQQPLARNEQPVPGAAVSSHRGRDIGHVIPELVERILVGEHPLVTRLKFEQDISPSISVKRLRRAPPAFAGGTRVATGTVAVGTEPGTILGLVLYELAAGLPYDIWSLEGFERLQ